MPGTNACNTATALESWKLRVSNKLNLSSVVKTTSILLLPASTATILATALVSAPIISSPTNASVKILSVDVNTNLSRTGAFVSNDS